jgi:uncharacterized protein with von Willebrand factor type A (vWA) domain
VDETEETALLEAMLNERPEETDIGGEVEPERIVPPSDTALVVDDWGLRKGEELLETSEVVHKQFEELGVPRDVRNPEHYATDRYDKIKAATHAAADFHAAAFEPSPQLAENPKNERIARYMRNLMETPEFQALHSETQLDEMASEMATAHFAKAWVAVSQQPEPEGDFEKDVQVLVAASDALADATEEIEQLRSFEDAMGGIGKGSGGHSKLPKEELRKRFDRARRSRTLARICQLAGRWARLVAAAQKRKVLHGQDDVVGVTLGGDVSSLIASEASKLADDDLSLDVMRRIVESAAMVRDQRGVEKVAKGPIVVIVDESGSMNGDPVCNAKAYALAMYRLAKHQNRWCCLVGFSGSEDGNYLAIRPGEDKTAELFEWLEHFFGCGTDMDVPLVELPKRWAKLGMPAGRTDIIQITDAECHVPDDMAAAFNAWKLQNKVKFNVILIGGSDGRSLKCVSDRIWTADSIDVSAEAFSEAAATI